MDLQELFSNLTTFQWVLLGVAAFLLWPQISKLLVKEDKEEKKEPSKPEVPNEDELSEDEDYDLTTLVYKWETFTDACHEQGLHEACAKAKEIFPLLVKPYEKKDKS